MKGDENDLKSKEFSYIDPTPLSPSSKVRKAMIFSRNSYILDQKSTRFLKFKKIKDEYNFPPHNFENFQLNANPNTNLNIQERECDESLKQGNLNQESEHYNASVSNNKKIRF